MCEQVVDLLKYSVQQGTVLLTQASGKPHQFQACMEFQVFGSGIRRLQHAFEVVLNQRHGDDIGGAFGGQQQGSGPKTVP